MCKRILILKHVVILTSPMNATEYVNKPNCMG